VKEGNYCLKTFSSVPSEDDASMTDLIDRGS
jgi:hypothetical protein